MSHRKTIEEQLAQIHDIRIRWSLTQAAYARALSMIDQVKSTADRDLIERTRDDVHSTLDAFLDVVIEAAVWDKNNS